MAETPATTSIPPIASVPPIVRADLPAWARELITVYESHAASQFLLSGNVGDRLVLPGKTGANALGSLRDFLLEALLASFHVVLSYDLGNGIRVEKGAEEFAKWPALRDGKELPKTPLAAIETLTRYFRYTANLARLGQGSLHVAAIVRDAHLVAPALPGNTSYDLAALASLLREWASDSLLTHHTLVSILVTENLADLHPLIAANPRTARVKIPLPEAREMDSALRALATEAPLALAPLGAEPEGFARAAAELAGATVASVESLVRIKQYRKEGLTPADLAQIKKEIVERDSGDLIEFVQSSLSLADFFGPEHLKAWLRQDLELWRQGDVRALPKGYLICGPVGTGKSFLVECLAGEAGVPVVKLKNFRDRWVGTTEGNLEKIFRLLHALGRCFVFIDEADQTLGKRDAGSSDSGLSGRVYSMIAQEMGSSRTRGKVIWILASSRPDLIEIDLKRPGRIDVRIPLFPTSGPEEGFGLLRALARRFSLTLPDTAYENLKTVIPDLLTPAAAEALAFKAYRATRTEKLEPEAAFKSLLENYRSPVDPEILELQVRLAAEEATDLELIPARFRPRGDLHVRA